VEEFYTDENSESEQVQLKQAKVKSKFNQGRVCAGYSARIAGECRGCELVHFLI
jgi:hypothetical protein